MIHFITGIALVTLAVAGVRHGDDDLLWLMGALAFGYLLVIWDNNRRKS